MGQLSAYYLPGVGNTTQQLLYIIVKYLLNIAPYCIGNTLRYSMKIIPDY